MRRSAGPWGIALAVSLLLHAILLGGLAWHAPRPAEDAQAAIFEARLIADAPAPKPAPAKPVPARPAAPQSRPPVPRIEPPPSPPEPIVEAVPPLPVPEAEPADETVAAAPAEPVSAESAPAGADTPPAPARPPLNALPQRIDLRFDLQYGLASGEQTLVWVNEGDRYTLTSVAAATGLTGVFYRGRFVQTSRGRITPQGLQPEEFWDQRGDRRSVARFNQSARQVTLEPARGAPSHFAYPDGVQDALSLFFQLALVAPPAGATILPVFNGKKLRSYTYEVRGEETLQTALGPLRTLRLARLDDPDGRFEAWLAIDRHYLPVRVLKSDADGRAMTLSIRAMSP